MFVNRHSQLCDFLVFEKLDALKWYEHFCGVSVCIPYLSGQHCLQRKFEPHDQEVLEKPCDKVRCIGSSIEAEFRIPQAVLTYGSFSFSGRCIPPIAC